MLRASHVCRAPLASLKPVLADSVSSHNTIKRFIGVRSHRIPNASAINAVVERTKGNGLAGTTASLARAGLFLSGRKPSATVEEIDLVFPKIQDESLKQMAIGLRLRARNEILDVKEVALNISGGAAEAEVSELRSKIQSDYNALKASSPKCWLVNLAYTEYCLYTGKPEDAYEQFVEIERQIKEYIAAPIVVSSDVASPANTHPYSLLGFILQRAFSTRLQKSGDLTSSIISEAITSLADESAARRALADFKKELGDQLSDEEALEVAFTLQQANVHHHFHDFFPRVSEYDDWTSGAAQRAKVFLEGAANPDSAHVEDRVVEKVRSSIPPNAFYGSVDTLTDILKNAPKDKSLIASIRAACGEGPRSYLSHADEAYFEALEALNSAPASGDTAGAPLYARRQREVSKVLAQQILYRTQVQIGVALTEMERFHEAVEVLTPVINASEYIYMWRALLARSRAYKGLGLVTLSDKDAKVLKHLQRSLSEHAPYEKV